MKKRYYLVALLLAAGSITSYAQNSDTKKADKHYDRLEFVKAAEEYKEIVEDGDATPYVYQRLADTYYNLYNTKEAERYYGMYIEQADVAEGEAYYRYAQMLKANKKYDESNAAMKEFAQKSPQDQRAIAFSKNENYLNQLLQAEEMYTVEAMSFNSGMIDFGGFEKDNKLYFVSARNKSRRNYGWNGQPTLDVYTSTINGEEYGEPELLEGEVNTKFNEGTVCVAPDGETMYFSRNDYLDGDYEKASDGVNQLKIFKATLIEGEWDDIQSVSFNDSEYSTAHPALSPDGKTLYFSSDMPGGLGQSDLYKVAINEDGSFGEPENLGPGINTEGRESFPYVDEEGTLYFSSDGQLGIGGLDVFYAEASGNSFGQVKNVGQPVSSTGDDFAYTYNPSTKMGYVSSNRGGIEENIANDNIYRVERIQPIEKIDVMVQVINAETGAPIADAQVINYDDEENQLAMKMTDNSGRTSFMQLLAANEYTIQANAEEYESNSAMVEAGQEGQVEVIIELMPIEPIIEKEEIVLNPIEFDLDKSDIKPEAALELDKVVGVMQKHPDMKIKVEAHTDKRGSAAYNQKLSERRAKSTVDYIISQGVDKTRISWEAFGESKPKVECDNCTEEQFQENRRSVFRIVEK